MLLRLSDNLSDEAVWGIFCAIMQDAHCSENTQLPAALDRIAVYNDADGSKVVLVKYPPNGYALPARSQVLGSIRWNDLT